MDIKVGDLVMQVHDCCQPIDPALSGLGIPGRIDQIYYSQIECPLCGYKEGTIVAHIEGEPFNQTCPLSWLRSIPPLLELDSIETTREDQMPLKEIS